MFLNPLRILFATVFCNHEHKPKSQLLISDGQNPNNHHIDVYYHLGSSFGIVFLMYYALALQNMTISSATSNVYSFISAPRDFCS